MRSLTYAEVKLITSHPVCAIRAARERWRHKDVNEEFMDAFTRQTATSIFAKKNGFSGDEKAQLRELLARSKFMITVSDRNEPQKVVSLLFITEWRDGSIVGFVARAKSTAEFPNRIDAGERIFVSDRIRELTPSSSTLVAPVPSWVPAEKAAEWRESHAEDVAARRIYWPTILAGVANRYLTGDEQLERIFKQPCFG